MFGFNTQKTIQAAAHILKQQPEHRINYMKLLKLLYLADRRSLKTRKTTICGDTPYAMEQGPVPSVTLDLIKGIDPASIEWDKSICRSQHDVILKDYPGNLELSRAELNILNTLCEDFPPTFDEWSMVAWCHDNLQEYDKNWKQRGSSKRVRIPFEDVLDAIGLRESQADIIARANEDRAFGAFFGDHAPANY